MSRCLGRNARTTVQWYLQLHFKLFVGFSPVQMPCLCLLVLLSSFSVNISRCFSNSYRFFGNPGVFQWRHFLALTMHCISRMPCFPSELDFHKFHLMATQLSWRVTAPFHLSTSFLIFGNFIMSLLVISVFFFPVPRGLGYLTCPCLEAVAECCSYLSPSPTLFPFYCSYLSHYISLTGTALLSIIYKFVF